MNLKKEELLCIEGGISISGALLNSFSRGIEIILNLGRSFGTSLRRVRDGKICPL